MYFIIGLIINIRNIAGTDYFFAMQLQHVIKMPTNKELFHIINNC